MSWGCGRNVVRQSLDAAEVLMEERPDSALRLLSRVDGRMLTGEPQARYALLLSQAYERNYIDVADDSLICIAVRYYGSTDDLQGQMRSRYYLSAVRMNQQDYEGALAEALDVEKMAAELGEEAYLVRSKILIARAYLSLNKQAEAQGYIEQLSQFVLDKLGRRDLTSVIDLYQVQVELDKYQKQQISSELRRKRLIIIVSVSVCVILLVYLILRIRKTRNEIDARNVAAKELFMDKFSWVEELGNIYLDAEASKTSSNRAMKDVTKRLESVKSPQFIPEVVAVINQYRNNLITRITTECPLISESERNVIALLCANLSTRVIAYILDIKPQSVYNAKSSVKRKLESTNPELLREMNDVF